MEILCVKLKFWRRRKGIHVFFSDFESRYGYFKKKTLVNFFSYLREQSDWNTSTSRSNIKKINTCRESTYIFYRFINKKFGIITRNKNVTIYIKIKSIKICRLNQIIKRISKGNFLNRWFEMIHTSIIKNIKKKKFLKSYAIDKSNYFFYRFIRKRVLFWKMLYNLMSIQGRRELRLLTPFSIWRKNFLTKNNHSETPSDYRSKLFLLNISTEKKRIKARYQRAYKELYI